MDDVPNFKTWNPQVLADFARDAFLQMKRDAEAIEQLRQDNKDLSKQLRMQLTKEKPNGTN